MNIRDLKYLIAIAETGNFGRAAEACFVSQPALSIQIKKLEETLGVQLIERSNKGLMFTEVGKLMVEKAREILYLVDGMHDTAHQAKDPFSGEVHLGIIPTLAPYLLPLIMPGLTALFPNLSIYLVEDSTQNLLTKVNQGSLDAALLALPVEGAFATRILFNEAFYLAVTKDHPLAHNKAVKLTDLENRVLLLLEDGFCLRDQVLAICEKAQASELKNFRATSLETLRHMVASGVGITMMPKLACHPNTNISYLPFEDPQPTRSIAMIWRESTVKKSVLEHIGAFIHKLTTT